MGNVGAKMDSMELEWEKDIAIQSAATFCDWQTMSPATSEQVISSTLLVRFVRHTHLSPLIVIRHLFRPCRGPSSYSRASHSKTPKADRTTRRGRRGNRGTFP